MKYASNIKTQETPETEIKYVNNFTYIWNLKGQIYRNSK